MERKQKVPMVSTETTTDTSEPSFAQMPLSDEVRKALDTMGYERPTPVQVAVWELAVAGRDVVVQARTGTGKTSAFGLPLIDRIVDRKKAKVQALILGPTRELALQVARELEQLCAFTKISTTAIYGGAPIGRQVDAINAGTQIISGTPGRVLDHLRRGTLDPASIKTLILDESDEMLSMGFERELTAIIDHLPKERQTLLFSATVPPDIERMARSKLHDPEFLILSSDQVGALEVSHHIYRISGNKLGALIQIIDIEDPESAIVFCNTKEQTETIAAGLKRQGYEANWLNGDLAQSERERVMKATREGKLRFLVATDVAARGIDISHLTHVINCDFPRDAESYVHRTGRTGRAGRTGAALSLVTPQDIGALYILRLTYKIRPIERSLPSDREQRTRLEADIVQALADTFAPRADAEHRALARRLLSHDDAEAILGGILREHLTAHPELPEDSESLRRSRNPAPVSAPPKEKPAKAKDAPAPKRDATSARADKSQAAPEERKRPRRSRRRDSDKPPAPVVVAEVVVAAEVIVAEVVVPEVVVPDDDVLRSEAKDDAPKRRRTRTRKRRTTTDGAQEAKPTKAGPTEEAGPPTEKAEPTDESPPTETPATRKVIDDEEAPDPDGTELHIDVGRKEGARVRALKSLLADGGVDTAHVRRVRVRERYTFIEVDKDVSEAALDALNGAQLGNHSITATVSARSKS
jgi:ATP-dependent RNA helicase DeaD